MNDMSDYEPPITMYVKNHVNKIMEDKENAITMRIEEEIGFHINKDELIKALQYDRDQYSKGYQNG